MKTKKKRQATNSTMRNVRAANKRIEALEEAVKTLAYATSAFIGTSNCKYIFDLVTKKKRGKK